MKMFIPALLFMICIACAPTQVAQQNITRCEHPKPGLASTRVAVFDISTSAIVTGQVVSCLKKLGWMAFVGPGPNMEPRLFDGATRAVGLEFGQYQSKGGNLGGVAGVTVLAKHLVRIVNANGLELGKHSFEQPGAAANLFDAMRVADLEAVVRASLVVHEVLLKAEVQP